MQQITSITANIATQQRLTSALAYSNVKNVHKNYFKHTSKQHYKSNLHSFIRCLIAQLQLTVIISLTDFTITEMYMQYLTDLCMCDAINYIM